MKIAFYKGNGKIFDKLIRWWTKSDYSHCQLYFENGSSFSAYPFKKTQFTSVSYNNLEWDFIDIPITTQQELNIFDWCRTESNCSYDYIGIVFCQIIGIGWQSKSNWFCSELCLAALQQIYPNLLTEKPSKYSPGKLYNLLKRIL